MCKAVEDYARDYAKEYAKEYGRDCAKQERLDAICRMIKKNYSKEAVLDLGYSESEYEEAEQGLLVNA